jgi:hypothetical protein
MACTRHKTRQDGKLVPVLKGLAEKVVAEAEHLYLVEFKSYRFVRPCKGNSKISIDGRYWKHPRKLVVEVSDNQHGEGILTFEAPHVAAVARHLCRRLEAAKQRVTLA